MSANPVGNPNVEIIRDKIDEVINYWVENHPEILVWWKRVSVNWVEIVGFLVMAGDYFIKTVDDLLENGPDKKATVMSAIEEVYDFIVPNLMPIWLKPFSGQIKSFVFGVVINIIIDYFVRKYREGEWVKPDSKNLKFM